MIANLKAILTTFWTKLHTDISELWDDNKIFVVVFGALILILKFREIFVDFLVSGGKALFNKVTNQTDALNNQENQDNASADALEQEAEKLINEDVNVPDDWYEKK
jgi:hypothetical protein